MPRLRHSQCLHRTTGCHPLIFPAACWSSPISSRFMPAISQAAREPCPASRTPSSCSGCLNRLRSRPPAESASSFRRGRGRSSALGQITPAATILHQLPVTFAPLCEQANDDRWRFERRNVMPTTARVARIHEYGPPEVLRFEDIVVGEPGDDEALIRNTVIGLNFVDVYYRRGTLPVPAFPAIIGDEAAGVVEAVGKNVKNVSVGDRVVYGDIAFGAYATARLYPADRLVRIPAGVSDGQAASAFLKGLTARCLLKEVLELRPDDTVLYHAAAGGVG